MAKDNPAQDERNPFPPPLSPRESKKYLQLISISLL